MFLPPKGKSKNIQNEQRNHKKGKRMRTLGKYEETCKYISILFHVTFIPRFQFTNVQFPQTFGTGILASNIKMHWVLCSELSLAPKFFLWIMDIKLRRSGFSNNYLNEQFVKISFTQTFLLRPFCEVGYLLGVWDSDTLGKL